MPAAQASLLRLLHRLPLLRRIEQSHLQFKRPMEGASALSRTNRDSHIVIHVQTGPNGYFFNTCNGPVRITLFTEHGKAVSKKMDIGPVNFHPNQEITYQVPVSKLVNPDKQVSKVEVFNDDTSSRWHQWHLETIVVENTETNTRTEFPYNGWVRGLTKKVICSRDSPTVSKELKELKTKQDLYQFQEFKEDVHLPAQVAVLPRKENFSWKNKITLLARLVQMELAKVIDKHFFIKNQWESLKDLNHMYGPVFHKPECTETWREDRWFGYQRVCGLNPAMIELCTKIPDKLPVTDSMLKTHLDGLTIQEAIDQKRLFIVDLKALEGVSRHVNLTLCAPIGLFFSNQYGELLPVAIQLFQEKEPGSPNPVFTPPVTQTDSDSDSIKWTLVKMWFNNADAMYHQSVTHLGLTHLLMEGIAVATNRQLPSKHPIYKLLKPHFLYTMVINRDAENILLNNGGYIDKTMTTGTHGTLQLIKKVLKEWRMDIHGTLPEDLKMRGLDDPAVLPSYHYRADALLLYNTIKNYVTEYTRIHYRTDDTLKKNLQLQLWAAELVRPRDNQEGGCGLQGVPGDGKLETTDQLVTILTSIIFTCSVQHAAVNFTQYEQYGYPPNYPSILYGSPPGTSEEEENVNGKYYTRDILKPLPKPEQMLDIMVVTKLLSSKDTNHLGFFEINYITETDCVVRFQTELKKVQTEIEKRNVDRQQHYKHLLHDRVPNAISI